MKIDNNANLHLQTRTGRQGDKRDLATENKCLHTVKWLSETNQ